MVCGNWPSHGLKTCVEECLSDCDADLHPVLGVEVVRPGPLHRDEVGGVDHELSEYCSSHQVSPPTPAACLPCVVAVDQCPTHAGRRCRACGGQLHRVVVDEGFEPIRAATAPVSMDP